MSSSSDLPPATMPPPPQHHPSAPAFTALLDAYARWQDFEQSSVQDRLGRSDVPGLHGRVHRAVPTPASLAFIMACPCIDVRDIPEDERNCPICTDPYHHLRDREIEPGLKVAQRLPCGHHLCDHCIHKWLNPFARSKNNTCPFDRTVFFPQLPPFVNTEGIQGRLDLIDWFNGARSRQPVGSERDQIREWKAMLVQRRLGEAIDELEVDRLKADTVMQSKVSARELDAAILSACYQELQQFEHRLTTVRAVADCLEGHLQISMLQARVQHENERPARD